MSKKEEYEARVEAYLLPIVEENRFELVDVEYVKEAGTWYLRAYIDKEGGFTGGQRPGAWKTLKKRKGF